jgi:Spy/CpxP family protein refolding chaperone
MKRLVWILVLMLAPALVAQVPDDSGGRGGGDPANGAQARQLRERIRQRWNEHMRSTLGLNAEQTGKLQGTEQRFEAQRQPLRARQRDINQVLSAELAAGTPDQERVKQLITERQENRRKLEEINRGEDREMQSYLSPVQQARYQEERRRFQERVAEVVKHRRDARGARGGVRKRPRR